MTATNLSLEREIGRRVAPRTRCDHVLDVRDGSRTLRALLSDFSSTGFRLAHVRGEIGGASLWLCPEGMEPIPAKVRWNRAGAMGCQFLYPLSDQAEAKLRSLVSANQPVPSLSKPMPMEAAA